jgi:hypothetical protein
MLRPKTGKKRRTRKPNVKAKPAALQQRLPNFDTLSQPVVAGKVAKKRKVSKKQQIQQELPSSPPRPFDPAFFDDDNEDEDVYVNVNAEEEETLTHSKALGTPKEVKMGTK